MMRVIKRIFVHCTGTRDSASVSSIKNGFLRRGWKRPGYHFLIDKSGKVHSLLAVDLICNGVRGYNSTSISIAYIGGIDRVSGKPADTRNDLQKVSIINLLKSLRAQFPNAQILGHRDISPDVNHNGIVDPWERIKECPCFDAKIEYRYI